MLIVMHHTDADFFDMVAPNLDNALQSFRVPMYYFLSGLFFKTYGGASGFLRKKVNNLVVPFLFFHVMGFMIGAATYHLFPHNAPFNWWAILYPLRYRTWPYTIPLWFLMSLFEVNVIFFAIKYYLKTWLQVVAIVIIASAGIILSLHGVMLPLMLDTAMVALPFFALGSLVREMGALEPSRLDKWGWLVFAPVAVIIYLTARRIDILMQEYPPAWMLYLIPAVSILTLLWLCKNIPRVPVLCYWGQYSLVVLGTHDLLLTPLDHFIDPMGLSPMATTLLKYSITMILEIPVIALIIKVFPKFTAQSDFFAPGWKLDFGRHP